MSFVENMRYDYPLDCTSFVIDLGGYEGRFASILHQAYACDIDVYEPIDSFFIDCVKNLQPYPIVRIFKYGVGGSERTETFSVETDRTGVFASGNHEEVKIKDIKDVIGDRFVDLIKINIEGMEYEVLERVIELGLQTKLKNIQVQFHRIAPDSEKRYETIREELLKTHKLTFDYPFVWQNFTLKEDNVV